MEAVYEVIQEVERSLYARQLGPAAHAWLQHALCMGTMPDDDLVAFSECGYMLVSTISDTPGLEALFLPEVRRTCHAGT